MAHPHNHARQHKVEKSRVAHIAHGYASGGAVDAQPMDEGATKKARAKRDAMAVEGKPARERMDRPGRAKGGRVKHGKTNVNVIVAPQGGAPHPGLPPAAMAGGPTPPVAPPPRPPMMAPPGGPPPGMPSGGPPMAPPPGMPHRSGGRAYAKGGAVKSGPTWDEGLKNGTPVQHSNGKDDGKNIGRGRVVTFKTGGAVKGKKYPIDTGSGGGEARLQKERVAKRSSNGMAP